jgi:hypothetical protein
MVFVLLYQVLQLVFPASPGVLGIFFNLLFCYNWLSYGRTLLWSDVGLDCILLVLIAILVILGDLLRFSVLSPMFFELSEAGDMRLIVIAIEGDMAVDADERCRFAPPEGMFLGLFLLERGIAVRANKGNHIVEV